MSGTIFDKVLRLVEKGRLKKWPMVENLVREARYFDFPYIPHEAIDKELSDKQMEISENFFLPFPVVAIEDKASCVILADTRKDQTRLDGIRNFISISHSNVDRSNFSHAVHGSLVGGHKTAHRDIGMPGVLQLVTGVFYSPHHDKIGWAVGGDIQDIIIYSELTDKIDGLQVSLEDPEMRDYQEHILRDPMVACEEIIKFNTPGNWVVQSQPTKRQKLGKGRLARVHQGPTYIMCSQEQLHTRLGLKGEGAGKASHARRRHFRTLKHERYGENQGKVIDIAATWIGPSEIQQGKRTYKVMLDI